MTELPPFRYHPDPIATGNVRRSDAECICCEQARGFIYTGPVYAIEEYHDEICPWCIADGTAHQQLDATFTDEAGVGGYGAWDPVSPEVGATVSTLTPGFSGWQQERWWTHCGDAAAFLGAVGARELVALDPAATAAVRAGAGVDDEGWARLLPMLSRDGAPTAYLFRCLHCGLLGSCTDSD